MSKAWKNRIIRAAAKLLTVALATTSCLSGMTFTTHAEGYGKNGVVRDITSQQLVEDMGLGYNLGNTFDSIGSFISTADPWEYQKGWGNDPLSKQFIHKVREAGFKTIRFPVSWAQWIDESNHIHSGYMNAVQTVVDWCMEEDMYVILNIHHDSGAADTAWVRKAATDWDWTSKRYQAVWTQIAENFKGYGDHLIFEGMNEVEFPDAPSLSRQYEILNAMNQLFVDSVRNTGGNNASRHLLIPGYNTNIERSCDRRYVMPNDPANHCILSIHYYSPPAFCVAEHDVDWATPLTTWGTEEDIQAVEADFDQLAERYLSKGTPVIIGEYGVLTEDQKEKASIQEYCRRIPELILEYGMCPILWDTSNAGDMKFIERTTGEFYDPVIKANYQRLSQKQAAGQVKKRQFNYPNYERIQVPVSPGGWVSLDAFEPSRILGIAFDVACSTGWDSYGGGGIYIDSWDNTINFQFDSVYDEVVHMFTDEERARLKDQLEVVFWWTDESNGGSRRDQLSIKGGTITLLYGENEKLSVPRTMASSGGSGGGGGGGGGGSSRPNNSTNAVGSNGNNRTKWYSYILKAGRNSAAEGDETTGIQVIDLKEICPGYEIGDTVRLTAEPLSGKGAAFQVNEGGQYVLSPNWDKSLSIECTPDDGKVRVMLWYMERNQTFIFNVKAEIVKKASSNTPELGPNEVIVDVSDIKYNVEGKDDKDNLAYYDHFIYKFSQISGHENVQPSAVRFILVGENDYGANLQSDKGYISWIDNRKKYSLNARAASEYLDFQVNAGLKIQYMIFDYTPLPEEPEEPELGPNEEVAEPSETKKSKKGDDGKNYDHYIYNLGEKGLPCAVRFTLSGTDAWGANLRSDQGYIKWIDNNEKSYLNPGDAEQYLEFVVNAGITIEEMVFDYSPVPELKEREQYGKADGKKYYYEDVKRHETDIPDGVRCFFSGAETITVMASDEQRKGRAAASSWVIGQIRSGETLKFDNVETGTHIYFEAGEGVVIQFVIFHYPEKTEEPTVTVGENEALAEAREGTKYYFADVEGREGQIPVGIRFKGSGSNENGSNLVFDNWSASGWVNFNSQAEVIQLFKDVEALKDETPTEFIELQDATLEYLVFIYDDASTASMFSRIAARALRSNMNTAVLLDETGELLAVPDEEGNYYLPDLPEENPLTPIGIRADVASNTQDVTLIFSEDQEESAILANKKAYYFFKDDEADRFESVSFTGQEVKNVTFLYWNGEKGEAAEKEGEYALPDYRIPAAISYYGAAEEDGKAEVKLMVQVYDKEAGTWKAEGKELVKRLAVDSEGVNWYIFTKRDRETLEDAFKKAKAGGVAPRLQFVSEEGECSVEELTLYYDTPYTDDMEITGPKEEMDTGNTSDIPAESAEPVKNETKDSADNDTPAEETQAPADQNTADDDEGADPVKPSEDEKDTGAVPEDKEDTGTAKEDEGQTESSKPSGTEGEKKDDAEAADPAKPSEDQEGTDTAKEDQEETGASKKDPEDTGTATEDKKDTSAAKAEADPAGSSKPSGAEDGKQNEESSSSRTEMTVNQQSSGIAENSSEATE